MAGIRDLLAGLFLFHFTTSAWAAQAAASSANSKSLANAHAASAVQRANAAARAGLHLDSQKAVAGAHLRGLRSRSSHSLRANVFRAASSSAVKRRQALRQAPLYVPKMGLANVTEPTAYPPPPPVLHPWQEMQPLDTAVGNYLISGLLQQPTITPPPSQSSLDLAFACPALLSWPNEVSVSAPDPCGEMSKGNWTGKDGSLLINWETSCIDTTSPGFTTPSTSPITTYTVPNGDLFGTSQVVETPFADITQLRDCGGATVFTVEEKIYKQAGKPDSEACSKYSSCDGVIYFQYFIKDASGAVVAMSPYTTIFQDSFDLTDSAGGLIAQVSRNGWEPNDRTPDCGATTNRRLWQLKYANSPPGIWATVTAQWPIAAFMTMLAQRDGQRQPTGAVLWSNCNVLKSTGWVLLGGLCLCLCVCIPMVVFLLCSAPILRFVSTMEVRLFPKRMGKPSQYGN